MFVRPQAVAWETVQEYVGMPQDVSSQVKN